MRILVIGLSRDLPLGPADAMELADHLVKRAAAVQADGEPPLSLSGPRGQEGKFAFILPLRVRVGRRGEWCFQLG